MISGTARVAVRASVHGFPPSGAGALRDVGAWGGGGTLAAMAVGARGPWLDPGAMLGG